ncbi:MAG: hypothetical protein ABR567_04500 [Myxococcales bacterium]
MLIRCQGCQALFSLQDGVAAAGAAFKVECGRCLSIFEAAVPAKVAPSRLDTPTVQRPLLPVYTPTDPGVTERKVSPEALAHALAPRRPDQPRRKGMWVAIAAVVALGVALLVEMRFAGLPRRAQERLEKARQLLLRDDRGSLEQATALFTEAARLAPGEAGPEGERAFALLPQAAAQKDLSARVPKQEAEEYARKATRSMQEGLAAAKAAIEDDREDTYALRAMALHAALAGAPELGVVSLHRAELVAPQDPWIAWTRAALALSGPAGRDKQDRALAALAVARQADPQLLRAQVDVAAISLDRQEPGAARDVLTRVLKENPQHERAKRLLALLPPGP